MTTLTIAEYNAIKKEAINKFMGELEDALWSDVSAMAKALAARDAVFTKLDKRERKSKAKGVLMVRLTTHGEMYS